MFATIFNKFEEIAVQEPTLLRKLQRMQSASRDWNQSSFVITWCAIIYGSYSGLGLQWWLKKRTYRFEFLWKGFMEGRWKKNTGWAWLIMKYSILVNLPYLCYYKSCRFVRGNIGFGSACYKQFNSGNVAQETSQYENHIQISVWVDSITRNFWGILFVLEIK